MKVKQMVKPFLTLILKMLRVIPIKKNKIVFSSFSARSYSDNPKYVAEELLRKNVNIKIIFILRSPKGIAVPKGVIKVKYNTLRYLYELATAKVWVDNTRKQNFIIKRNRQIYIQTWHGALPFKKIEKDTEKSLDRTYIETAKNDSAMIDYMLTDSQFGKRICENSFWYKGKVVVTGSPRLDRLINKDDKLKENAISKLCLDRNIKYALYAPTFRDNGRTDVYNLDFDKINKVFSEKFGGKWKTIVKLHPNVSDSSRVEGSGSVDASNYDDVIELYAVSRILITDYSSTMFEFALTNKPVFLYTPDVNEYLALRSSYFNIYKLPFSTSKTQSDLVENIRKYSSDDYLKSKSNFFENLHLLEDGKASKRVVEMIQKNMVQQGD